MQKATFPLHPAQEDVYADQFIHSTSPHYNVGGYIRIEGPLNKEIFRQTVDTLPFMFDVYKMRFDLSKMEPLYHFDDHYDRLEVGELDLSHHDNPSAEAQDWMQRRFNTPFPIEKDLPLFEHCLIKVAPDEHWFFCRYHHLITDGYGFIVFVQYLARRYKSLAEHSALPFDPASYHAEAVKAVQYKTSAAYDADRKYWLEKITGKPQKFLQRRYTLSDSFEKKSAVYHIDLDERERALLDDIQRTTKSGLQQLTIAALLVYFGKTSDQSEFVFGIPVHKRGSKQARTVLGMFSGIIPHKAVFRKGVKVDELLNDIAVTQKQDYRHYNLSIGEISRALKINPSEGYLCDVIINYELLDFEIAFDDHTHATIIQLTSEHQRNPLQISWRDYGSQQPLQLHISFWNECFTYEEVELLARRIMFIIKQFPCKLKEHIESLDMIPPHERRLLEGFNHPLVEYPENKSIVDRFEEQAECTPAALAVAFENKQLSYKELNERSNQLAHYLRESGVREEMLVPLCVQRSFEMIVGILGILKAGGAYVPIDPQYPPERINYILEDTHATILVCDKENRSKFQTLHVDTIVELGQDTPCINKQHHTNPPTSIRPDNLAYVIYTSGSTGKPKGVMIEHAGVVNLIQAQSRLFNITGDEKILQFSNYCFDASVEQIFLALFNGASIILVSEEILLHTGLFVNFLKEEKITHLHATPLFLETLPAIHNGYLKRVIAGGDICKKELMERWIQIVDFYNEYGPTETTVTAVEYKANEEKSKQLAWVPIGRPVTNTQVYILDKEEQLCPVGVPGELCIGGVQVGRGYLNLVQLTADKFIADQFSKEPERMLYKTGDLARWLDDGNIEYLGRRDDQVKIRGYRMELGEIESVLRMNESVKDAVVLAKEDKEGNKRLVGYIVPYGVFNKETAESYLRSKLPGYMIPAIWVELKNLPLTSSGKINKKALPDPNMDMISDNMYEAPGNETEAELANIWMEVLNIEHVGVHNNFFELGGHSLKAIQLISRMHKRFNIQINIKDIFSNPTIKELSRILTRENSHQFAEIKRLPEQDLYELSHAQKRIWVLSHFKGGSLAYSVPTAYILEGILQVAAFKRAFDMLIERHEILRTVFVDINGEPRQKILPFAVSGFNMEEIDITDDPAVGVTIKKAIEIESKRPFDLAKGPLLRAILFRIAPDKHIIVFNIHHITSDGWSKGVMIKELLHLYRHCSAGVENKLTPLPIQYKDYTIWQAASIAAQGDYWRKLFKNDIPVLNFPLDFERPKLISFSGARLHAKLSDSLVLGLQKIATQHNMTLNNLLLSLYGMRLAQYCRQDEVVIGSLTSGRNHVDLENLIGVFINFLPIRLTLDSNMKLSDYLKRSHDILLEAYSRQDYPFDRIVSDCVQQRDVSRNPIFDTMVNFHWENNLNHGEQPSQIQFHQNEIFLRPYQLMEDDFFHSALDFMIDIDPIDDHLEIYLSYNSNLFTRERMRGFLDGFVELLDRVASAPDNSLGEYNDVTEPKTDMLPVQHTEALKTPDFSVTICSSFVTEPLKEYIDYWSEEYMLHANIIFAPYNQVFQELLHPDSNLNKNKGMNVLFIRIEDWLRDKKDKSTVGQAELLNQTYREFMKAVDHARTITATPYLIGIVPLSPSHPFCAEIAVHIQEMNGKLESYFKDIPGFYFINLDEIATLYSVEELFDSITDEMGHIPFTQEGYAAIGTFLSRQIRAYTGTQYKVIALDCDNTLWKGICGEVGTLNVMIDENFSYFQKFLLNKYDEGFLLVLCSKNNEDDVRQVFEQHPEMIIRWEHIAAYRLNWRPKHENLVDIAKELQVGADSIVFFDDSKFEVEQMAGFCPQILSLELPEDVNGFSGFLDHIWALDRFHHTQEDLQRNEMYKREKLRKEEQAKYHLLNDFLQSLNIQINLRPLQAVDMQRAVQLSQRTNQFNLNGVHRSSEDIVSLINDHNAVNWIIEVKDRFGDYGIVGLVLAGRTQHTLLLNSFMLSCRVLGRNVEDFVLSELQNYCMVHGLDIIEAQFKSSGKNKPFAEFLDRTNWTVHPETNAYCLFIGDAEEFILSNNKRQLIQ